MPEELLSPSVWGLTESKRKESFNKKFWELCQTVSVEGPKTLVGGVVSPGHGEGTASIAASTGPARALELGVRANCVNLPLPDTHWYCIRTGFLCFRGLAYWGHAPLADVKQVHFISSHKYLVITYYKTMFFSNCLHSICVDSVYNMSGIQDH